MGLAVAPKILACPADKFPKVSWLNGLPRYLPADPMPWSASARKDDFQVNPASGLPDLTRPGRLGVGIYWQSAATPPAPNWNALGYKSTVVSDPAGSILLCENTHGQQCAGNIWTCICVAPRVNASGLDELRQVDYSAPAQNPNSGTSVNQGALLYKAHRNRFNYVFNDGHVDTLRIEQTIGSGTLTVPKGMWTVTPGD